MIIPKSFFLHDVSIFETNQKILEDIQSLPVTTARIYFVCKLRAKIYKGTHISYIYQE